MCIIYVVRNRNQVNIRWPLEGLPHPRLTSMALDHDHAVDREATEVAGRINGSLDSPMKRETLLLTGGCTDGVF